MPDTKDPQTVALTIAGSDPSGGAGIQADIKTFTAIGVYCGAAITSLTAQNTLDVFGFQAVDPAFVRDQIGCVLSDLDVSHIKIGMLGSAAVGASICDALADFRGEIIYDPVLVSSSGRQLIDRKGFHGIRERLLALCTVITPNVPELSFLTDKSCVDKEELTAAAAALLQQCEKMRTVIITGGHFRPEEDTVTDYLCTRSGKPSRVTCKAASHPRIKSRNTHGTGCTFSAAFTAYHLLVGDDAEAFRRAVRLHGYHHKKKRPFRPGSWHGPSHALPQVKKRPPTPSS